MGRYWRVCVGGAIALVLGPWVGSAGAQGHVPVFGAQPPAAESAEPLPADFGSSVSFIDSALPRSNFRLRFDLDSWNRRPTFAEYYFPSDGFRKPESKVHLQELSTFVEFGLNEWFSTFMETPFRWINPERNDNLFGIGDLSFGGKFAFWNDDKLLTAFQLKFTANTSQHVLSGTGHWSIDPSILVNYRILDVLTLEGQAGYWVPLGGTDYAGDLAHYGLGLSYGQRTGNQVMLIPVAEVVGWTATSGRALIVDSPSAFHVVSASGDTILNGCLGLRLTLGGHIDIYAGYARRFVGDHLFRDMARVEFRISY